MLKNKRYYDAHKWIINKKGKPKRCEYCRKNNLIGHSIHWANRDHKYRKRISDWIRLCASCHKNFDTKRSNNGIFPDEKRFNEWLKLKKVL